MRTLVTGATSLLGRVTVEHLSERGDIVTVLQRRPSGLDVREVLGDITDPSIVARAVEQHDAVIHLAAKVDVTGAWAEFERINVDGTSNLLDAARRTGVGRFVHVSSPSVAHGGDPLVGAPAGPADPSSTRGHYATSKAHAELIALDASSDEMPVVVIRPHLVWGPGDEQLVGRIVQRAQAGRLALVGSGAALIDSTYVDNAAAAIVAAVDRADLLARRSFVVSNGQPRTVGELVNRILVAAGRPPVSRHVPTGVARWVGRAIEIVWEHTQRATDPPMTSFLAEQLSTAHWFDQRETRAALQWAPTVGIDEGFDRLAAWYRRS